MNSIFGITHFGGHDAAETLASLAKSQSIWAQGRAIRWDSGSASLGAVHPQHSPEAYCEPLPRWLPEQRLAFTVEARLDNREALCQALGIAAAERASISDGDLLLKAYLKWDDGCPQHLVGDWSFAAWQPDQKRLFLARDHCGNTALYFYRNPATGCIAFSSSAQALHAMGAPRRLNELLLAQGLVSWTPDCGLQTIDLDIQRLPPAHALTATAGECRVWRYWKPEDTPELTYPRLADYLEGFLDVYGQAVRARCRSLGPLGVTLSGGLDSGSVTALAGRVLAERGQRLRAFTQVPIADTSSMVGPRRFGDETELACATAASLSNIDHELLRSERITPIQGIEQMLRVLGQPTHAASNAFWILDLLQRAQECDISALLTGQGGNATISWTGAPELRGWVGAFTHGGWKAGVRRVLPFGVVRAVTRLRYRQPDWSHTAIHPDFARRLELYERQLSVIGTDMSVYQSWRTPRDKRYALIQPGSDTVGDFWAALGAAHGMEIRDPTRDPRVVAYTLSVPDPLFERAGGLDRQLIRQAMAGLLPDEVRLNSLRGRQSADLAARLHRSAKEVDGALDEVATGLAPDYLNVARMRQAWHAVRDHPNPLNTHRAGSILLRGLMAGLWLNRRAAETDKSRCSI